MGKHSIKTLKDKSDEEVPFGLLKTRANYDMDGVDATMVNREGSEYETGDGLIAWLRDNAKRINLTPIEEKLSSMLK